jgi:PTH1 family peptidyl-tRNA hydrolase
VSSPKLIVGLGNPGAKYRNTRHNAGFIVVDRIAEERGSIWRLERKFSAEISETGFDGGRQFLAKPQTYMNLSGEAVVQLFRFYRVKLTDLLVVLDDADLPLGSLRMRSEGSAGGHHGLESIEQHLGSNQFARAKLGIARPNSSARDIAGHVLGNFGADELALWTMVVTRSIQQIKCWAAEGVAKAMNQFNGVVRPPLSGLINVERNIQ